MHYLIRRRKLGRTSCRGISAASREGIQVYRNDARNIPVGNIVFRWGCTSNIDGQVTVNRAEAIHNVSNKARFRQALDEKELCPKTWFRIDDVQYPAVVRPQFHAQGRRLFVVRNAEELRRAAQACGEGWYASELINKVKEYRVFVCQGRAVWVTNKTPGNPADVAWNVARGGKFENIRWDEWPLKAIKAAIEAIDISGLDFGGVDIMEDKDGEVYVLEINAAPSQTSEYRQQCVAKAFDYIVRHGKAKIPLIQERGGYRKFIHPALCNNAQVP